MLFFKKKSREAWVTSPAAGMVKPLKQVPDPVFSAGTMGDGFAIEPDENLICAPISGEVSTVFPGGHAIGITAPDGAEALIHIGIDTVKRKGDGFKAYVKGGEQVTQGDKLAEADIAALKDAGFDTDVIFVISSGEKCVIDEGMYSTRVTTADRVMKYEKK